MTMFRRTPLFAVLVLACAWGWASAEELLPLRHVVVFNNNGRTPPSPSVYPLFRLSEPFGLVEDFYALRTLDAAIVADLAESRMLYIGQYCDESPLFDDQQICRAIRSLLKRGGLLLFDYGTGVRGVRFRPSTVRFLKSVGVTPPGDFRTGYGASQLAKAGTHAVLSRPHAIAGRRTGHYGWWQKWAPNQVVLAHDRKDKARAVLVLHDHVLGKGTVIFSQLPGAFRERRGTHFHLVANIIAYAHKPPESAKALSKPE